MNDTSKIHDAGHSLGLWLFDGTSAWFEFVLHTVLVVAPAALGLILAGWVFHLVRYLIRSLRQRPAQPRRGHASGLSGSGVFRYILKHTRRSQFFLLATALLTLPLLYAGLELPKQIINNVVSSDHFPVSVSIVTLAQTEYLFLLCATYLALTILTSVLKYIMNVKKGRVAESLLRRLRLTIYRSWRRNSYGEEGADVIPMLVQEVEPIGGFAGDALVLPLFQGGTFLTILAFMLVQDPVLGAAAVTLLPVQLSIIPRLQAKINGLARRRAREMRSLGGAIGKEIGGNGERPGETRREVADVLRRIEQIRFEIYRRKFFMKGLNNFITHLTPFFFYTVGGYLVIEDRLSFGALVAVLAAHKDFSAPLKELLKYYQTMEDVRVRFDEIGRFLQVGSPGPEPQTVLADPFKPEGSGNAPHQPTTVVGASLASALRSAVVDTKNEHLQPCVPHGRSL